MKELKQYIEKELQAKKFLSESLDLVTQVENLATQKSELESSVPKLKGLVDKALTQLSDINDDIDEAKKLKDKAVKDASEATSEAKSAAAAILKKAREDAEATRKEADKYVEALQSAIDDLKETNAGLVEENSALTTKNLNIKSEKEKLLSKLAG